MALTMSEVVSIFDFPLNNSELVNSHGSWIMDHGSSSIFLLTVIVLDFASAF